MKKWTKGSTVCAFLVSFLILHVYVTEQWYPDAGIGTVKLEEKQNNNFPSINIENKAEPVQSKKPNCSGVKPFSAAQTKEEKVQAANCGSSYDPYSDPNRNKGTDFEWRVVLYGKWKPSILGLSGCPIGNPGVCPASPRCSFRFASNQEAIQDADVLVVLPQHSRVLEQKLQEKWYQPSSMSKKQFRVLYLREPSWSASPSFQSQFDIRMGVLLDSGINNPLFLRRPHSLYNVNHFPFRPFRDKTGFGMSMISNCDASNRRQVYLDHLVGYLGSDRIHQYGACGDGHQVPRKPITMAAETISSYLFYFAFENSILPGYTTEKLFASLNIGSLPVYLGDPDAIPITTTPSYIDASKFQSPKDLATYLLYLSNNETAYMEYHRWRSDKNLLDDNYLELVAHNFPSVAENSIYDTGEKRSHGLRRALCCRLCNENELRQAVTRQRRQQRGEFVPPRWTVDQINERLFSGDMFHIPNEAVDRMPGKKWGV